MFRPSIQKLSTLMLMSVFCVVMAFISMYFKTTEYKKGYSYKVEAREVMSDAFIWLASDASNGVTGGRFIGRFWGDEGSFRVDTGQMPQIL